MLLVCLTILVAFVSSCSKQEEMPLPEPDPRASLSRDVDKNSEERLWCPICQKYNCGEEYHKFCDKCIGYICVCQKCPMCGELGCNVHTDGSGGGTGKTQAEIAVITTRKLLAEMIDLIPDNVNDMKFLLDIVTSHVTVTTLLFPGQTINKDVRIMPASRDYGPYVLEIHNDCIVYPGYLNGNDVGNKMRLLHELFHLRLYLDGYPMFDYSITGHNYHHTLMTTEPRSLMFRNWAIHVIPEVAYNPNAPYLSCVYFRTGLLPPGKETEYANFCINMDDYSYH